MHSVIVANAPDIELLPFSGLLRAATLLVAADGGANALRDAGIVPHLVVGDLDSLEAEALTWLEREGCELLRLPREKDETDLELALLLALRRGATVIDVLGALGGRLDHTLANVHMLAMDELAAGRVRLLTPEQELLLVRAGQHLELDGLPGDTVSLLPLSALACGVTIEGFYYPLVDATLRADRARGVSNVMLHPPASVALGEGLLLVIHHFDGGAYQFSGYPAPDGMTG